MPEVPESLSGITVLDLSRVLAGPYATMILADMGARVIKIEQPGRGDDTRRWGPPFTPNGESAYFLCANRNKQSVTVNLKSESGRDIVRQLALQADVLIENFKTGTLDRLGLGYERLRQSHPGLVYCSLTGYGQTGPYADRPGYDNIIEAQGGLMSITGPAHRDEPYKVGVAIVDITAGLYAVSSILAALRYRDRSGAGQFIDIALFDVQLSWLANVASSYLISGEPPQRYGNGHASIVPYQALRAADRWLMIAVGNDSQFSALCRVLGMDTLAVEERFRTNQARVQHRDILIPMLEGKLSQQPAAYWTERLLAAGIPCSPVNDVPSALSEPQADARSMIQQVHHSQTGDIPMVGPAPKMSVTPLTVRTPPPLLGEHTEIVLSEMLGLTSDQLNTLRADGAI